MMSKFITLISAALISLPAAAQDFTVDVTHTYPTFEISHLGFSVMRGRFNKSTAKLTLDRAAKKGSVEAVIDAASIDTGLEKRDTHLRGGDFFNVEKYPTIKFVSNDFKFDGDQLKSVSGQLTILDVTKPATLEVKSFHCGMHPMAKKEACGVDAHVTIKRSDFGVKYGLPVIGDDVKIAIEMEAISAQ